MVVENHTCSVSIALYPWRLECSILKLIPRCLDIEVVPCSEEIIKIERKVTLKYQALHFKEALRYKLLVTFSSEVLKFQNSPSVFDNILMCFILNYIWQAVSKQCKKYACLSVNSYKIIM